MFWDRYGIRNLGFALQSYRVFPVRVSFYLFVLRFFVFSLVEEYVV